MADESALERKDREPGALLVLGQVGDRELLEQRAQVNLAGRDRQVQLRLSGEPGTAVRVGRDPSTMATNFIRRGTLASMPVPLQLAWVIGGPTVRPRSSIDAVASAVSSEQLDLKSHTSPDGAVTLMFSDIESSTAMIERMGDDAWFAFLRDHRAVVRALADTFGGTVIKSQGDGFMVAFSSARSGLRCAIELQRTFAEQPGPSTRDRLRVRMGLHSGHAIADSNDFHGLNVVIAARIADSARGGEILVSSVLKEYTDSDPTFAFEARGALWLKGLSGEHEVFAVRW